MVITICWNKQLICIIIKYKRKGGKNHIENRK
jgi:hypothetical protein